MKSDDANSSKRIGTLPSETYSGAEERGKHREGKGFNRFFDRLMFNGTMSCWERDVLRGSKEYLWERWKERVAQDALSELEVIVDE